MRTLVVDDEPLALDLVKEYVEKTPFLELVDSCNNAQDAFDRVEKGDVQLLFLDVQMPGMSGLTLAKSLAQKSTKVIFTTAFDEYAVEGFKLDAVDYLLKPFDFDEFMKAALKAKKIIELEGAQGGQPGATSEDGNYFFVKSEYKLVRIDVPRIIYIEGLKDYIKIYLDGEAKPILTLNSLKEMENRLPASKYIRVHRSYIVNVDFVRGVERNLIAIGGTKVPMGEGYKQNFTDIINRKTL
ncbi:MAG: response regulator transcription factor [Bacteroidales bacterium]|nr:response regulator transcription factor [Bacteroidales bacterium]